MTHLEVDRDIRKVVELADLLPVDGEESRRDHQQRVRPADEEPVPDQHGAGRREGGDVDRQQPLREHQLQRALERGEVRRHCRDVRLHQVGHDLHVDLGAGHRLRVVPRKHLRGQAAEGPEGHFLGVHRPHQSERDEIHRLAVADRRELEHEGQQQPAERRLLLGQQVARVGPRQVLRDLKRIAPQSEVIRASVLEDSP